MKKIFIILILTVLLGITAAHAKGGALDLSKVSIPKKLGTVKEFYQAPSSGRGGRRIIFYIQDVHANYEAQKNMAGILEHLIQLYGIEVVLVEGGITDKDFSYIREWAPIEERKKKADKLLKDGVITGETYVDIATDFPLKFQGIENKGLYEKNMEIYLKVDGFRGEALNVTAGFKKALERLKKFIYTKDLKKFDSYREGYTSKDVDLKEYFKFLDEVAAKNDISLENYPNHILMLKTARDEERIDFDKTEKERDALIEKLNSVLSEPKQKELILRSVKFKQDEVSAGAFYSYLSGLANENGVLTRNYSNFELYVEYIRNFDKMEHERLFEEIEGIEGLISAALFKNEKQKGLFKISKDLLTLEALLKLKLTPEDLGYYRRNKKDFDPEAWRPFLTEQMRRFRIKDKLPEDTTVITANLANLEAFYETAFKRDRAFLKNSLAKLKKEKENIAFFITGGFHTESMTRLFKANDISYIIITPSLTKETDHSLYDRTLKEAYETRTW